MRAALPFFSREEWSEFRRKSDLYEPLLTPMAQAFPFQEFFLAGHICLVCLFQGGTWFGSATVGAWKHSTDSGFRFGRFLKRFPLCIRTLCKQARFRFRLRFLKNSSDGSGSAFGPLIFQIPGRQKNVWAKFSGPKICLSEISSRGLEDNLFFCKEGLENTLLVIYFSPSAYQT